MDKTEMVNNLLIRILDWWDGVDSFTPRDFNHKQFPVDEIKKLLIPDKWCIALDSINYISVNEWVNSINPLEEYKGFESGEYVYADKTCERYLPYLERGLGYKNGYTRISTEFFAKFISKKDIVIQMPSFSNDFIRCDGNSIILARSVEWVIEDNDGLKICKPKLKTQ